MALNLGELPDDLPHPVDDGACDHLAGMAMPSMSLVSTSGGTVDVASLQGRSVIFAYPMTGQPGVALPDGWDAIPCARGCTPQHCAFRDLHAAFLTVGAQVHGLSTQTPDYQREMAKRLHLPYPVLSDSAFAMTDALRLPTMDVADMRLIRRLTLIVEDGTIAAVFYPVFPPDRSAEPALEWLRAN